MAVLGLAAGIAAHCETAMALPFFPRHPPLVKHRSKAGDWRLDIVRNEFSGEISCRLRSKDKRMVYHAGAIGFRFKRKWDVHGAVYRLDKGEPRAWRGDLPELVRLGAAIDGGAVENASGGVVWLAFARLREVNSVTIQPRTDRKARTFHLRGLGGLYESALGQGCSPDSRFAR